jgi:hypothetical protein
MSCPAGVAPAGRRRRLHGLRVARGTAGTAARGTTARARSRRSASRATSASNSKAAVPSSLRPRRKRRASSEVRIVQLTSSYA